MIDLHDWPAESVHTNYDAKSTECHRRGTPRDPALPPQRSNLSRSAQRPGPLDLAQAPRMQIFSCRSMPRLSQCRLICTEIEAEPNYVP